MGEEISMWVRRAVPPAVVAAALGLIALTPAAARADLSSNPNALPFTLTCGGSQVEVLSPSPTAASGHVLTTRGEAIAYLITQTENGSTTTIFQLGQGQRTGQAGFTTTCTSIPDPGVLWTWSVIFTPAGS
jgi:hypothetical protein